jgi:Protein of unknown function (DUF4058)
MLPQGYYAEVEQHVWLGDGDEEDHEPLGYPDAYVAATETATAVATAPRKATRPTNEVRLAKAGRKKGDRFVKIVDRPGNRLITVIELLSPSNKTPGPDRVSYLGKREDYFLSGTNLVEIDLLRDGERIPSGRPRPAHADYCALVSRADRFPVASFWAFSVRDPLPVLPVPLKPKDGEVDLELRPCLDRAYEDAGYWNRVDYSSPPAVALCDPDADWAKKLLAGHQTN